MRMHPLKISKAMAGQLGVASLMKFIIAPFLMFGCGMSPIGWLELAWRCIGSDNAVPHGESSGTWSVDPC